jgi:SAM-dependent methyltransferase
MKLHFFLAAILTACLALGQIDGGAAYSAFTTWKQAPENRTLKWDAAIQKYKARLIAAGLSKAAAENTISIITSRDEGVFYDTDAILTRKFLGTPNKLLIEAVAKRKPGRALDVAMGQGRNAIHLARLGWEVTGFDTSAKGLAEARELATAAGVTINAIHASDEEFDFGKEQWDLIAILNPTEKRSVHRVRQALKPGGLIVFECSYEDAAAELPKIFEGFQIIKHEDTIAEHEWARKPLRMVRLIAQKP